MDDPEGNLVIVERVVHENQRRFPDWEHGWGGTAHILTITQDGAVEQKEQKEVKYIVPYKKVLLSLISGSFCLEEVAKPGRVACPYATAEG